MIETTLVDANWESIVIIGVDVAAEPVGRRQDGAGRSPRMDIVTLMRCHEVNAALAVLVFVAVDEQRHPKAFLILATKRIFRGIRPILLHSDNTLE